ncbi:hypothetical protein [Mycobacterium sp. DBP42]|uniref:hypothetical protein n=1 Tax=Mycobacteriaceae TaxID=1762 RepID=UPI00110CD1A2|nr:hypothetical protein [Mycobacterium sp. DBP42]TMS50714.1 hypothetical protein E0T84_22785 [Mycobacterium sp. DBP42]
MKPNNLNDTTTSSAAESRQEKKPAWINKLSTAATASLGLAAIGYVMMTGFSIVANAIAPGLWGYVGAAGFVTFVGPIPLLLFSRRSAAKTMVLGLSTMTYATIAHQHQWPGWTVAAWPGGLLLTYLALRTILSIPARLTRRRAARLLRRHRATGENAWTLRDWEWAYTQLGTKLALHQAAWCRMLRTGVPPE